MSKAMAYLGNKQLCAVQKQIAQEALALSLFSKATVGFAAGRKFEQVVSARQGVSYVSVFSSEIEQAQTAQAMADALSVGTGAKRLKISGQVPRDAQALWQGQPDAPSEAVWKGVTASAPAKRIMH